MTKILRPLAALAMLALIVAGCSNGSTKSGSTASNKSGSTAGNQNATHRDKAVRFAECMRENGVSGFPDPDASGAFTVDEVVNGSGIDPESAAWQQAIGACQDLQPPGFTGHERTPEQQEAALAFAQCVRDHGVKDFPDPGPDDPLVDTNQIPSSDTAEGMNILNAAMQQCPGLAEAAGVQP
jgi:hypothetical protein